MYRHHSAQSLRTRQPARGRRRGFTLVELLVVITIIAMLVGLLIPAVQAARNAARKSQCLNNQQNVGKAIMQYVTTKEKFPPLFTFQPSWTASAYPPAVGWVPSILPYLEQNEMYRLFQSNSLRLQPTANLDILVCPSQTPTNSPAPLSYALNGGAQDSIKGRQFMDFQENGVFFDAYTPNRKDLATSQLPKLTPPIDLSYLTTHDGSRSTILFSENNDTQDWTDTASTSSTPFLQPGINTHPDGPCDGRAWWSAIVWGQPPASVPSDWGMVGGDMMEIINRPAPLTTPKVDYQWGRPSSNHSSGQFCVSYADGHSAFMSQDVEYRVYVLLMTPDSANAKVVRGGGTFGDNVAFGSQWYQSGVLKPLTDADMP